MNRDQVAHAFGAWVRFTHPLRRAVTPDGRGKVWIPDLALAGHRTGVLIGVRTLSDGSIEWGYDEPVVYTPATRFPAALIAWSPHRRPVLVRLENVDVVGGPTRGRPVGDHVDVDQLPLFDPTADVELEGVAP